MDFSFHPCELQAPTHLIFLDFITVLTASCHYWQSVC